MSFWNWIQQWNPFNKDTDAMEVVLSLITQEVYKRLAVDSCANLIASTISGCEFKTYDQGKVTKKDMYYLLNVAPNPNENAAEFRRNFIYKLLTKNEALIVMANKQLFVADGYNVQDQVLKDTVYSQVTVKEFQFKSDFLESEVIHLKLNNHDVKHLLDGFYKDYGKLIASAQNIYKRSNAKRFVLEGEFIRSQNDKTQEKINNMMTKQFKPFLEADNAGAVFQLQKGFQLNDVSGNGKVGQAQQTSRDVRALVDDVFDYVATAYHVPRALLKGDMAGISDEVNSFLMFCINPLVQLITTEFNKKLYEKADYLKGSHIAIDTSKIKVVSLSDEAAALDKLFSIGGLTINDVIQLIGGESIDEDWANKRYVTKNYLDVTQKQPADGTGAAKGGGSS